MRGGANLKTLFDIQNLSEDDKNEIIDVLAIKIQDKDESSHLQKSNNRTLIRKSLMKLYPEYTDTSGKIDYDGIKNYLITNGLKPRDPKDYTNKENEIIIYHKRENYTNDLIFYIGIEENSMFKLNSPHRYALYFRINSDRGTIMYLA
jgi:hypothetical protein